jgi:hypothetical protein
VENMEMQPSEIADRYTIVKLKVERTKNEIFNKEYVVLKQEIAKLKKQQLLKDSWINELYKVNLGIWNFEAERSKMGGKIDYERVGRLSLKIRRLNVKRTNIKRKITTSINRGYVDKKINYYA